MTRHASGLPQGAVMTHFRCTAITALAMALLGTGLASAQTTPPAEKKIY